MSFSIFLSMKQCGCVHIPWSISRDFILEFNWENHGVSNPRKEEVKKHSLQLISHGLRFIGILTSDLDKKNNVKVD